MNRLKLFITSGAMFLLPVVAMAQLADNDATGGQGGNLINNIITFINNTLIPFILAIAFLVFVWGIFKFFILGGGDEEARSEGKNLMMYAVAGFLFILIFWGIVELLVNFTGLGDNELNSNLIPTSPNR